MGHCRGQGKCRVLAYLTTPNAVRALLEHPELPTRPAQLATPQGPPESVVLRLADTFVHVKRDVPHAELEDLRGAGHFLQEEVPGAVAQRLARFFAR